MQSILSNKLIKYNAFSELINKKHSSRNLWSSSNGVSLNIQLGSVLFGNSLCRFIGFNDSFRHRESSKYFWSRRLRIIYKLSPSISDQSIFRSTSLFCIILVKIAFFSASFINFLLTANTIGWFGICLTYDVTIPISSATTDMARLIRSSFAGGLHFIIKKYLLII